MVDIYIPIEYDYHIKYGGADMTNWFWILVVVSAIVLARGLHFLV